MAIFNPLAKLLRENMLIGLNYREWKRDLDIVLTAEQCKYVLTEDCPPKPNDGASKKEQVAFNKWIKDDEMARCYIMATVSNVIRHQHQSMKSASIIMLKLKELFGQPNEVGRQVAMKALLDVKMVEDTPVWDHVLMMISHLNEMEILGANIDGETQIDIILHSLPKSFEQFRLNYNTHQRLYPLAELLTELHAAEKVYKIRPRVYVDEKESTSRPGGQKKKKIAQRQQSTISRYTGPQDGVKKPRGKCFMCHSEGHWKKDCPLIKRR